MADSISILHLWYQWIQTWWTDQGHGEASWCFSVYRRKTSHTELHEFVAADDHIEYVYANLLLDGQTYSVGIVYRSPNSNVVDFNNTLHAILEITRYSCYIMGDLILDLLKHDKHPTENSLILCMPIILYQLSIIPLEWPRILALSLMICILTQQTIW